MFKPSKIMSITDAHSYKSLYISDELAYKVNTLAKENNVSFSEVVRQCIEYCIKELDNNK